MLQLASISVIGMCGDINNLLPLNVDSYIHSANCELIATLNEQDKLLEKRAQTRGKVCLIILTVI